MNRILFSFSLLLAGSSVFFSFVPSAAAAPFEISGWMPYWRVNKAIPDVEPNLGTLTSVMPFGYIVQNDGSLYDAFGLESGSSTIQAFVATAHARGVRVVPTVMWSNGAAIAQILRDGPSRRALAARITKLVYDNGFDGIDIDFENKMAGTRPYFALFLEGLYSRMGPKWVYCAVEPRTPPKDMFAVVPKDLQYANDYVAINKYCDRVEIMAYDQGMIDLNLNASHATSTPYVPLSDPAWVRKVVTHAAKTIDKRKIMIGIPTYGYEYDFWAGLRGYRYKIISAFNPQYATELAAGLGITPKRNIAGEMSFSYMPTTTRQTATTLPDPGRILWWSDASAINDKLQLARELGVRGVAVFKFDGGEDQNMWLVLKAAKVVRP